MKRLIALAACLLTPTFAMAEPKASLPETPLTFSYYAPKTKLTVVGDVVLTSCDPLAATMSFNLKAAGAANTDAAFLVDAAALGAASQKRDIKFELYENGTLKSLNAMSSDRSGAAITNVLKAVATVAATVLMADVKANSPGAAALPTTLGPLCNERTWNAWRQVQDLKAAIAVQRDAMGQQDPAEAKKIGKSIDALAAQLAAITQADLTLTLTSPGLDPGRGTDPKAKTPKAGEIRWTILDLAKWFAVDPDLDPCQPVEPGAFWGDAKKPCELKTAAFGLNYTVAGAPLAATEVKDDPCVAGGKDDPHKKLCRKQIVVVDPGVATVTVTAAGSDFVGKPQDDEAAKARVALGQWGKVVYIPVNVGWMKSRTVGLTFDEFGRKQTFSWSSEATIENATSALNDFATNGAAAYKAAKGPSETTRLTEENTELEARQKNVILKACQAAMDAGATACPKAPE